MARLERLDGTLCAFHRHSGFQVHPQVQLEYTQMPTDGKRCCYAKVPETQSFTALDVAQAVSLSPAYKRDSLTTRQIAPGKSQWWSTDSNTVIGDREPT